MQNSNSILAKLLANENITVLQGNFRTAYFDLSKRTLGLPVYKQYTQDVTNLMIGHEVGHALFTPFDGWHDSDKKYEFPRSFINVVEDIRIERMIQTKYPGLVSVFKRGYKTLVDEDFFGTSGRDLQTYALIDRINIKAKLADLATIEFSNEESPLVDQAFAVKTFEDVLVSCQAIYDFMKSTADEKPPETNFDSLLEEDEEEMSQDDSESLEGSEPEISDQEANSQSIPQDMDMSEDDSNDDKAQEAIQNDDYSDDQFESETDLSFRRNETNLVDESVDIDTYVSKLSRVQADRMTIDYEAVSASREKTSSRYPELYSDLRAEFQIEYDAFYDESKKITAVLAKEFEMRKAAYRSQRSRTSRSGVLNTSKLHNYKFSDDIFKSLTVIADDKSHGMIMMIDYSGSMSSIINSVIKQTLNLAFFCKKVNIPFKVFGFTNSNDVIDDDVAAGHLGPFLYTSSTAVFELLNSSLKPKEFDKAAFDLYFYSKIETQPITSVYERLGSTPLNQALLGMEYIIDDFRKSTNVQKMNFVLLTDGAAQRMNVNAGENFTPPSSFARMGRRILMKTKNNYEFNIKYETTGATISILEAYRKDGINTIGFFLAESAYDFRGAVWSAEKDKYTPDSLMREYRKKYNSQKFITFDNTIGYDRYFIVKGDSKSLNTDIDELDIDADASQSQINKSFMKFANSKKANRILASQFAQIIA